MLHLSRPTLKSACALLAFGKTGGVRILKSWHCTLSLRCTTDTMDAPKADYDDCTIRITGKSRWGPHQVCSPYYGSGECRLGVVQGFGFQQRRQFILCLVLLAHLDLLTANILQSQYILVCVNSKPSPPCAGRGGGWSRWNCTILLLGPTAPAYVGM